MLVRGASRLFSGRVRLWGAALAASLVLSQGCGGDDGAQQQVPLFDGSAGSAGASGGGIGGENTGGRGANTGGNATGGLGGGAAGSGALGGGDAGIAGAGAQVGSGGDAGPDASAGGVSGAAGAGGATGVGDASADADAAVSCDDGDLCTVDSQLPSGQCVNTAIVCTALDACHVAGVCDPATGACSNPSVADGTVCSDGSACTQTDTCQAGSCVGGNAVVCAAADSCHNAGTCDPGTGVCSSPVKADGASCDDGNACTQGDTCQNGTCTGGTPVTCTALDQCHDAGVCNPTTGVCTDPRKVNGAACNDGNGCTQADTCQAGACAGTAVTCSALDQCHVPGTCNPATGQCSNPNRTDGTVCSDGNACTQTDTCQAGVCNGANPVICTALDQCHVAGFCNQTTGVCTDPTRPNGASCSDGNACSLTDTCQAGVCVGSNPVMCAALDQCHDSGVCNTQTGACTNPSKTNGSACSDGNFCTQVDSCQSGACQGQSPVVCTALDQCHVTGTCDPTSGLCSNPNRADGTVCSDGNPCTQIDSCQTGSCSGTNPVICTALDQCHNVGTCSTLTGQCSNPNKPNGASCNDGNGCTQIDACQVGSCLGTAPITCTALDQCHLAGTCSPGSGTCSNPLKADGSPCNDSLTCTVTDVCTGGTCGGPARTCDDGISCTVDSCSEPSGCQVNPGSCGCTLDSDCEDGNPCNGVQVCDQGSLTCVTQTPAVDCTSLDDGCNVGTCDPSDGSCSATPRADGTSCDDADACTQTDTCQSGACGGANPVTCTELDQCHDAGTCDPATGTCSNPNKVDGTGCDDGLACTTSDACTSGVCGGAAVPCDDGIGCTVDICVEPTGCGVDPSPCSCSADVDCEDGNPCNGVLACDLGTFACVTQTPAVDCTSMDDACNVGVCDPSDGTCQPAARPDGTACADADLCTQSDTCQSGTCTGGGAVVCTALDACHAAGTCDPGTGQCSNPNQSDGTSCTDGDGCTQSDSCQAGTCTGANPVICAALDSCHDAGTCDPGTGTCSDPAKANGSSCDDSNACTQTDTCQSGTCTGASPVICTALDQCHDAGTCNPANGQCSNPNKSDGTGCDDTLACTASDACLAGVCSGTAVTCDDGIACTVDGCAEPTGCTVDPTPCGCQLDSDCEDGNPCNGVLECDQITLTCVQQAPAVDCTGQDDACNIGTCDPSDGSCAPQPRVDGTVCDDVNACTQASSCQSGTCTGTNPIVCTALDQCHVAGTCNPGTGLCSDPTQSDGTSCDDSDACSGTDTCQTGTCTGSDWVVCVASDTCHNVGTCDSSTGICSDPPKADGSSCDDANACTLGETCSSASCTGGVVLPFCCGNGFCELGEDAGSCGADCSCGDGFCDATESAVTCATDCGSCGNSVCEPGLGEDAALCPADCSCGDSICDASESVFTCATDCGTCGNFVCELAGGEDTVTCPNDCVCGDGLCDPSETAASCPSDCTGVCANADLGQVVPQVVFGSTTGQADNVNPSCSTVLGSGDYIYSFTAPTTATYQIDTIGSAYDSVLVILSTCGGPELGCSDDAFGAASPSLVQVSLTAGQTVFIDVDGWGGWTGPYQLNITYVCGNGVCDSSLGETASNCADCQCGDTVCDPSESDTSCPVDCACGNLTCEPGYGEDAGNCPDCYCGDAVCDGTETDVGCPGDCACGNFVCEPVYGEDTTTCATDCSCGDAVCDGTETNASCPVDCACGNSVCEPVYGEDTTTCATDCSCGDAVCDGTESDVTCPSDCSCGNSVCEPGLGEDTSTCPSDCYCGDGVCDPSEDATGCPSECGGTCADANLGQTVPNTVSGTTVGQTDSHSPACGTPGSGDVIYSFTAPASGVYQFDTLGSSYDTVLVILGACGGAELDCHDDVTVGGPSLVTLALAAGQTVFVVVDGFGGATGAYQLNVTSLCGNGTCDASEGEVAGNCAIDCNTCGHSLCTSGAPPPAATCDDPDDCVEALCAADAFCCTTAWDAICVSEVAAQCGIPCQ